MKVNERITKHSAILTESPLERGWIARMIPTQLRTELNNLMTGSAADTWREAVRAQLIRMCSPTSGIVLQDGGELVRHVGDQFSDEDWKTLAQEFFPNATLYQPQNKPTNEGVES